MLCVELSSNRLNREAVVLYSMNAVEIQFSLSWTNWSLYSQMYIVHTHATQMPGTSNFICVQYTRIFMMHTRPIDRGWRCSEGQTKRANKRERKKKNSKKQKRIYRWSSSWVMRMCVSVLLYHWLLYHLLQCWFHLEHTRTHTFKVRNIEMLVTFIPPLPASNSSSSSLPLLIHIHSTHRVYSLSFSIVQ